MKVTPFAGTIRREMKGDITPVVRKTRKFITPAAVAFHFRGVGPLISSKTGSSQHRMRYQELGATA